MYFNLQLNTGAPSFTKNQISKSYIYTQYTSSTTSNKLCKSKVRPISPPTTFRVTFNMFGYPGNHDFACYWECCQCEKANELSPDGAQQYLSPYTNLRCLGMYCYEHTRNGQPHTRCKNCMNLDANGDVMTYCDGYEVPNRRR